MSVKTHVEQKDEMYDTKSDLESESDEMEIGGEDTSEEDEEVETENMGEKQAAKGDNSMGLANVMAKILTNKVPRNTQTILAKGMTEREIQKKKRQTVDDKGQEGQKIATVEKKKLWEEMARVKPNPLDKDKERRLQKIATRGVVQLFNAVKKQQKTVEEKLSSAGSSERKRSKVMGSMTKGAFLDLLKGTRVTVSKDGTGKPKIPVQKVLGEENQEEGKWNILREDFMMGATLKDWDKESSGDEGGAGDLGDKEDSDSD